MAEKALIRRTVGAAVREELEELARRAPEVRGSALAALAWALAREVDDPGNSATAKSMCAGRLIDALDRLRDLIPPAEETDSLDELRERRLARVQGAGA